MRNAALKYALALVAVGVALGVRAALSPWLDQRVPYITLFGAVIVAAWYGGAPPALVAAFMGWLGAEVLLIDPVGTIRWRGLSHGVEVGAYMVSTVLIAAVGGAMHRAGSRARDSDERFRAFIENSPVAVFIKDGALRYVFANREAQKALGTSGWEGKTDFDLVAGGAAERIRANDRAVLDSDAPRAFDLSIPRPDGEHRYHSTKFPLRAPDGGRYLGVVSVDVTEQWRGERAMRDAQALVQAVADAMPAVVSLAGPDLRYLWINRQGAKLHALRAEEIVGLHVSDVLGTKGLKAIRPYIERAIAGEEVSYERLVEYPLLGKRWVSVRMAPAATPTGAWVAVVSDIHDRRLAEQALREADRRKDEFLATLAHELRNPLAPIRNAVAILSRKDVPEADLAWSRGLIERQVEQMTRLIDDLLDVARISSGKLTVRRERIALGTALDMAIETSRPHLEEAGVRLDASPPDQDLVVDADPTRLAQVFANILNNAARYSERGAVVQIGTGRAGDDVLVRFADTGIGFPPELAEQLFEPFMQLAPSGARAEGLSGGRAGGLGLGLALARGIVALHGGSIEAKSAGPGRGSEFLVRLPSASTPAPGAIAAAQAAVAGRSLRVLVADDNRDAADSLARVLMMSGHETQVAYDGASALEQAATFRPEAAVLDIGMPGMSGYDVARALRGRLGSDILLIALTGWGQGSDRERAAKAGFDHHLTKPTDPGAVAALLAPVAER